MFMQYVSDRRIVELRWLANQRQYLGIYDPEVEQAVEEIKGALDAATRPR